MTLPNKTVPVALAKLAPAIRREHAALSHRWLPMVGRWSDQHARIWWSILLTFQKLMIEGRRCARRSPARPISALACWRRDIALAEIRGAPPGSARATCVKGRHPRQPTIVGVAIAFQDSAIELAHPTIERTAWSFCSLSIYRHADGRAPPIPN
jgi:hypothetical protein